MPSSERLWCRSRAVAGAVAALLALAAEARIIDAMPLGPSVAERVEEIRARIQRAVVYPPLARRRELTGTAFVRFEIDARGRPVELDVSRSTGHPILDRAAARSVHAAGALPYVYGRLEVPVRFALDAAP